MGRNKTLRFWYNTDEEGVMVQIKNKPIGQAHAAAIELLHEKGHTGASKQNVRKVN